MLEKLFLWLLAHGIIFAKGILGWSGALMERRLSQFRKLEDLPVNTANPSRIAGNVGLFALWTLTSIGTSYAVISIVKIWVTTNIGLFYILSTPPWLQIPLTFLILDFTQYVLHRIEHAQVLLWRMHSVHHSDQLVDMSTSLRKHPLAALFSSFCLILVVIGVGITAEGWLVYNIVGECFGFLTHSNYRFPAKFNDALERLMLISPQNHRVHHSTLRQETDSNFGVVFSIWDRAFGTYQSVQAPTQYGLCEVDLSWQFFPANLLAPLYLHPRSRK
jgi:sterol desaturase/sphingolipid hydroxylase (fatty acid hydroxylase superfamily)